MKVLVVDDDVVSRARLEKHLTDWGYEVVVRDDGQAAWEFFTREPVPLLITDWMMPGLDGVDLVRFIRATRFPFYVYVIILTGRATKRDVVRGMDAGADDFIAKPFDAAELRARVHAGERIIRLEAELTEKMRQIKTLHGLLPICMHCKKIRDDHDYWIRVEEYIGARTDAGFSHGICPDCMAKYYPMAVEAGPDEVEPAADPA